jgi:pilus assembly protein FimV
MNRTLKLSMMMALALGSSQVLALDMGQVQVKSALGQPLLAEIPLHSASPAELHGLSVQLASSDEFARAGIVGGRTTIPLHFSVSNAGGRAVIRITSSTPVDDPYLDLLLQVNSSAGKSVREFAILLDPPGAAASEPVSAPAPVRAAAPLRTSPVASRASAVPSRANRTSSEPAAAVNGKYGPVARGQTLSSIAHSTVPSGVDVQQMMLALKQANPGAFYRDNINALKSGEVLRVPTPAEAQAMSIAAAIAEVRRQNSDWRAGTPGKPTVVANAATRQASAAESTATSSGNSDRLSLVPARDVKGAGAQGGGASGSGKNDTAMRQDLLRAQEGLASAQQQSTDLKTRLKDLTDINSKNEHLLSLKDNQIAELQAKLAAASKAAGQPVQPAPAATAPSKPAESAAMAAATLPATSRISPASPVVTPPAPAMVGTVAGVKGMPAAAASTMAAGNAAAPTTTTSGVASNASTAAAATPLQSKPLSAPVKPAAKPAHKPTPASAPVMVEQPWYMQTWAWAAAGGVVVLLLLLAMLGRRKAGSGATSKSASSLADRFGAPNGDPSLISGDDVDQEELLDQLAEHPDDIGLHLELVTLYYSRRDIEHFEAAAEAMHAHITDPEQDEWQDVLHMGEDLAPGHPLFDHHVEPVHAEGDPRQAFDIDDYAGKNDAPTVVSTMPPLPVAPRKVSEYSFNFDLSAKTADHGNARNPVAAPPAFDDDATVLAPLVDQHAHDAAPAEPAATWHFDDLEPMGTSHVDDEFNDDPIDTKLDLARAYLDMGDADGARAMLGEVMKEGSQIQRDTAKRLLDGLH